jgi:hypothetical protein
MDATKTFAALNDVLSFSLSGNRSEDIEVQLAGIFVASLQLQISADGVTFNPAQVTPMDGTAVTLTMTTPNTYLRSAGVAKFGQVKCTAYTSGSPAVTVRTMRRA